MWHTEIWLHGRPQPDAELVYVGDEDEDGSGMHYLGTDTPYAEPGPTLQELDTILDFIAQMYPDGWVIKDGTIVDYKLGW